MAVLAVLVNNIRLSLTSLLMVQKSSQLALLITVKRLDDIRIVELENQNIT